MRKRRALSLLLLLLVVTLIGLRLALPGIVEREINARLANMGEYSGQVERVSLALWRGAYALRNLQIEKRSGAVPVPFIEAPTIEIALGWRNLFRGEILADVRFESPVVHFVDGFGAADSQAGLGVNWRARLEELAPINLNEVVIRNGTLVFHNFTSEPPVDIQATNVDASIRNLTNVRDAEGRRVAELTATATFLDSGKLESEAHFDPLGRMEDFSFALRILDIDLTQANELARAYANLDFESGNGELVLELDATDGKLSGYAKPLFQQIKIFSWKNDVTHSDKNPLKIAWEALAGAATTLFKNQPADQFATRIEIQGELGDPKVNRYSAIVGILRNAFVEALQPYFDETAPARPEEK